MDSSQGLGTPTDGQPAFDPPSPGSPAPEPVDGVPSRAWAAPLPGTGHPAPPVGQYPAPPHGRGPTPVRRTRVRVIAAVLAVALAVTALAVVFSPRPAVAPVATPTATSTATSTARRSASVVTVTPSAQPTTASTTTSGGSLGTAVPFATDGGSGTVTVSRAVWSDSGEMAPPQGQRYLSLDVTVTATSGEVPVDAILFLAETSDGPTLPGFGPDLDRPLGGRLLRAGQEVSGQLGYVLTPGPVRVHVVDETLQAVAEIEIPAP